MNDEELVSTNACEATSPSDDPTASQDAQGGDEAENAAAKIESDFPDCGSPESEKTSPIDPAQMPASDPALSDDPVPDPDPLLPADPDSDEEESLEHLRNELNRLRAEIAARDDFYARVGRDYEEFRTLYPEVSISDLPDSVWRDVKCGIPIAAAYALAEQRERRLARQAEEVNLANASRSSGALHATEPDFFSLAEVRAMSRDEVRRNYQKIMQSMKKWN